MRSTHRCLGLDRPGPSGFNERIHKKQVLPYLGSSQNYLYPCVSSEPNFNPTNIFGIFMFNGSFLNVLKSKKDASQSNSNICGLRLGTTLCHPHECNYDKMVKPNKRHELKFKYTKSQTMRQGDVKKLIKLGLEEAKFLSMLEPIL